MSDNAPLVIELAFVSKHDCFNVYEAGGMFYAVSQADPMFCLQAENEDAAAKKGMDALDSYRDLMSGIQ